MDRDFTIAMGNAVRKARHARGLTQEQVAEQLEVSVDFYARIERGRAHPSIDTFLCMMSVLDASADTLLGLDEAGATGPAEVPLTTPDDSPAVRSLARRLRRVGSSTVRMVSAILKEFEQAEAAGKRARSIRKLPAEDE
jgi:transcriptional regulator with XRE-family HTH domain